MRLEILAKNYDIGQKFQDVAEKKVSRLDKYFDDDCNAKLFCKKEKKTFILEITVYAKPNVLRAESRNDEDMYSNIDLAINKLIRQIHKYKDRVASKISDFAKEKDFAKFVEEAPPATIVKKKTFALEPRSVQDAIAELELVDHSFYVFLNNESGRVNVLYKRLDGDYGLIETIV